MLCNTYRWHSSLLISRNNIEIDKFIYGSEFAAAQATPRNHKTSPENAILSKPLAVSTPAELADLNQVPKFDVLLTDYGTGKCATKKLWQYTPPTYSRVCRWVSHRWDPVMPYVPLRAYLVVSGEQVEPWMPCMCFNARIIQRWSCDRYSTSSLVDGSSMHERGLHELQWEYAGNCRRRLWFFLLQRGRAIERLYSGRWGSVNLPLIWYVTNVQVRTTAHQGRRRSKLRTRPQMIQCNNADGVNLVDFLRSTLLFKLCDRLSAGELLGHRWLSSWSA